MKHQTKFDSDFNELGFASKVSQALNENLNNLPSSAMQRLALARQNAIARKKKGTAPAFQPIFVPQLGNAGSGRKVGMPLWSRMGVILPLLVLAAGLIGIYQYEAQQRINETADIDALVLADELPISAYLDNGFNAFLTKPDAAVANGE
jgi:Protein of unknown function (DUF3619)